MISQHRWHQLNECPILSINKFIEYFWNIKYMTDCKSQIRIMTFYSFISFYSFSYISISIQRINHKSMFKLFKNFRAAIGGCDFVNNVITWSFIADIGRAVIISITSQFYQYICMPYQSFIEWHHQLCILSHWF